MKRADSQSLVRVCQARQLSLGLFLILATTVLPLLLTEASPETKYCMKMQRQCRIRTDWNDDQSIVNLTISCFCQSDEPEDVWDHLNYLTTAKCLYLPTDNQTKVTHSTIKITGCSVQKEVFPPALLELARRTNHLEIVFDHCPKVRIGQIKQQQKVPFFNVTFLDSKLTGIPRGWLAAAEKLQVRIERCEIPIVESKAISEFEEDDDVQIDIVDTTIYTVKMLSFDLPPHGKLAIKGGKVTSWERSGHQGGEQIELNGVTFGNISDKAFNLFGINTFVMTKCEVAQMVNDVVIDTSRGIASSKQNQQTTTTTRKAEITDNEIIKGHGESFINLCKFSSIVWRNNTLVEILRPPIKLQDDNCKTERDWQETISFTGISCLHCEDFEVINEQSCAFYRNSYCTSCKISGDFCERAVLPYLLKEKCPETHPQLVSNITNGCHYDPNAPVPSARSLNGAKSVTFLPVIMIILLFAPTIVRVV